jgi:hypothetical protein
MHVVVASFWICLMSLTGLEVWGCGGEGELQLVDACIWWEVSVSSMCNMRVMALVYTVAL